MEHIIIGTIVGSEIISLSLLHSGISCNICFKSEDFLLFSSRYGKIQRIPEEELAKKKKKTIIILQRKKVYVRIKEADRSVKNYLEIGE